MALSTIADYAAYPGNFEVHHKIIPFELSAPDRYSRLFPPAETVIAPSDRRLEGLAWSMYEKTVDQLPSVKRRRIPAGYTYFGQFIDHDITFEDFRPLKDGSVREPRDTPNFRRNWLNLDSLYGGGPYVTPELYQDDGISLKIGLKEVNNQTFDVPLDPSSDKPIIAEPRNLENAIVRQIHGMFLKLHNLAVKGTDKSWTAFRRYSEARRRVCHQYQWLVRHDFLPRICERAIYDSILKQPLFDWCGRFSIPVEFARAGFRFGHSMVRKEYALTIGRDPVPLLDLFGDKDATGPLSSDFTVPWLNFLYTADEFDIPGESAMEINTGIVAPLFHIPGPSARLFKSVPAEHGELVLPHITLQRGAASRLPSGQVICRFINAAPIVSADILPDPWLDLECCGLREQTPLWYYILFEAEQSGHGSFLGPVGSRIVGEVIEGALRANKDSYLRWHEGDPEWKPGKWETTSGKEQVIRTLYDVATVVGTPKL